MRRGNLAKYDGYYAIVLGVYDKQVHLFLSNGLKVDVERSEVEILPIKDGHPSEASFLEILREKT